MTTSRLETVEEIFHAALDCDVSDIAALLEERCGGDGSLRLEVEELLEAHRAAGDFIGQSIAAVAANVFVDEPPDGLIGRTIGHYRVERRIGSGGMGVVYLAQRADQQYEKLVAIKLIKRGMDTEAVLRHFRNERQILASFDHPNIARLLDGDTTEDGLPYFVMEYVEGIPIDDFCDRETLSVADRLQLFLQVCAAVSYAHRRAVIHRDIKPSNILVDADGAPKLLDFGIAKLLSQDASTEPAATMIGAHVMTPEYASPEQVLGQPATTASDVYSLGVVLYRLLTGRLPYRPRSTIPTDGARTVGEREPPRPSTVVDGQAASRRSEGLRRRLRGDLDNIVLMALRREAERRYPSVEQFSEDIRRHLATLPVLARPDTLGYRSAKFIQRNAAATLAATLVLLSLVGGIVATTWQAQKAREQEARAERRFAEVRQLAHAVLFDYHDAIKDLPGATAARDRLVKDGLAYLDSLAQEAAGDPSLQRELADGYERLGDVRGAAYSANLGDIAGARDSYSKALEIRAALVAAMPQDVQGRRELAGTYVRLGSRMAETDEAARGREYLQSGVALYRELAAERPDDAQIRGDLASAYTNLGLACEDWGDASGALENQRQGLALRAALSAADPGDETNRRNLSVSHINLGRALVLNGDVRGGLASNEEALKIHEALLTDDPDNASYRRTLAIAYQNDGDYRALLGDGGRALQSFRRKLVLDEQAVADDPANAQARGDLAYTCERLADLLEQSGQYGQALAFNRRSLALFEKLSADQPQQLHVRYRAILSRASLGELQARHGERVAALEAANAALAQLGATARDPTNSMQSGFRAQVYMSVAATHATLAKSATATIREQREHWTVAGAMYRQSLQIWEDMRRRGILTDLDAKTPGEIEREIADCDEALRRLPS
jgi:non-specific serine/threonine protein kinase/serine/threonine-protein kinase